VTMVGPSNTVTVTMVGSSNTVTLTMVGAIKYGDGDDGRAVRNDTVFDILLSFLYF
jgi:hypothetical protein